MIHSPRSWQFNIEESKKFLAKAQRLSHFSVEILKENRSIIKVVSELHKSTIHLIKAFLDFERINNNLKISNEPKKDIMLFFNKIAPKYFDEEESGVMLELLKLAKNHKESHLEFVKQEKFIIFSPENCKVLTKNHLNSMIVLLSSAILRFPEKT
jgi:hypothetical protein